MTTNTKRAKSAKKAKKTEAVVSTLGELWGYAPVIRLAEDLYYDNGLDFIPSGGFLFPQCSDRNAAVAMWGSGTLPTIVMAVFIHPDKMNTKASDYTKPVRCAVAGNRYLAHRKTIRFARYPKLPSVPLPDPTPGEIGFKRIKLDGDVIQFRVVNQSGMVEDRIFVRHPEQAPANNIFGQLENERELNEAEASEGTTLRFRFPLLLCQRASPLHQVQYPSREERLILPGEVGRVDAEMMKLAVRAWDRDKRTITAFVPGEVPDDLIPRLDVFATVKK